MLTLMLQNVFKKSGNNLWFADEDYKKKNLPNAVEANLALVKDK